MWCVRLLHFRYLQCSVHEPHLPCRPHYKVIGTRFVAVAEITFCLIRVLNHSTKVKCGCGALLQCDIRIPMFRLLKIPNDTHENLPKHLYQLVLHLHTSVNENHTHC